MPILREVPKFDRGKSPDTGRLVPMVTVASLIALFTRSDASAQDVTRAVMFLQQVSTHDSWLVCDCQGATATPPVMYPQRVAGATDRPMTLVPLYARGQHHNTCPFARSRPEHTDSPWSVPRNPPKGLGVLSILKASKEAAKPNTRLQKGPAGSKRLPSLAGVLFKVLEAAGLHRVSATKRSVTSDKEELRRALANLSLDGAGKIPAASFVRTSFYDLASLEGELAALNGVQWPGKLHPQGLLVEQLKDVEQHTDGSKWLIPTYGNPLKVDGRLYLPGAGTLGPYVAIALVAV